MISFRRFRSASLLPRRPMARPVGSARPVTGTPESSSPAAGTASGAYSPFRLPSLAVLTVGTPFARIGLAIDMFRLRRPGTILLVAGALGFAGILTLIGHPGASAAAGGPARSALDAFGAATATSGPAGAGAASGAPALGAFDPIDLVTKGGLVVVLLFITLRVLRRVQGGTAPADARIRVVETRTIGAKTQLHLVAVGDRQILIGATPGRLVTLAELSADETEPLPVAAAPADAGKTATALVEDLPVAGSFAGALGLASAGLDR